MNKVLFLVEQKAPIIKHLGVTDYIEYYNQSSDKEITKWLINHKKLFEDKERIAIPCNLGVNDITYHGIYIATHIRLTKELGTARLLPIVFYNADSKEYILQKQINESQLKTSLLLYTKGCALVQDPGNISSVDIEIISEDELISDVLPNLMLFQTRDSGHKLANEWGVFRLAEYANYKIDIDKPTSLYTKYKDSYVNTKETIATPKIGLYKKSCNALLIDDNANKGWFKTIEFILRKRVVDASLGITLNVIESYEEAIAITDYQKFDVIFLDLRLYDWEDNSFLITPIEKFSGTKLLKKIKDENKGTQVIIFTASNKIWNIDSLKSLGADNYYIKESPEFIPNNNFSQENYNKLIHSIEVSLGHFPLREIYKSISRIKILIDELKNTSKIDQELKNNIIIQLNIAYQLIAEAKEKDDFAIAYIILYKCIELVGDYFIVYDRNCWALKDGTPMKEYEYSNSSDTYRIIDPPFENKNPTTAYKIISFCKQNLNMNNRLLSDLHWDIFRRNKYIHAVQNLNARETSIFELIYCYNGFKSLLNSIELIFNKMKVTQI